MYSCDDGFNSIRRFQELAVNRILWAAKADGMDNPTFRQCLWMAAVTDGLFHDWKVNC